MTPKDHQDKLNTVIEQASEELLQCRLNIITSMEGHIHVTVERFFKKQITIQYKPISGTIMANMNKKQPQYYPK